MKEEALDRTMWRNHLEEALDLSFDRLLMMMVTLINCRYQWPRGLRRESAAARLLRLWVRIPPGGHGYLSLESVVCCQVEVSA